MRRRHQDGQLIETEHGYSMRHYLQGTGERKRVQRFLGTFTELTRPMAKTKMREALLELNQHPIIPTTSTLTFAAAAEQWIADCETRKRKPIKPSVIVIWRSILANHLNPQIGSLPLSAVDNGTLKSVVAHLHHTSLPQQKLSPATVQNIVMVAKQVIASAVDKDGNSLFQRTWNSKFIDAPRVEPEEQNTPCFTSDEVSQIVKTATGRTQMLCVLLGSTGLRIGEALGLECKCFDGAGVRVVQTIWGNRGKVQKPKTKAGEREVDLHPDAASLLKSFIGTRKTGFVFQTSSGKPLTQSIVLRRGLHPLLAELGIPRCGFHAFRRYRNTHLRQKSCPDSLLKMWMGHKARGMSELYDKSKEDLTYRQIVALSMGTGFDVPKTLTPKREKISQPGVNARFVDEEMPVNIG